MSIINDVVGAVTKNLGSGTGQSGLMQQVLGLANNPQVGGLSGLVQKFRDSGLDNIVSSWIGHGSNLPVEPQQIQQVLGNGQINELAAKAGVSPEEATSGLAQLLPQIIDKLTPNGEVPSGNVLEQGLNLLKGKF